MNTSVSIMVFALQDILLTDGDKDRITDRYYLGIRSSLSNSKTVYAKVGGSLIQPRYSGVKYKFDSGWAMNIEYNHINSVNFND